MSWWTSDPPLSDGSDMTSLGPREKFITAGAAIVIVAAAWLSGAAPQERASMPHRMAESCRAVATLTLADTEVTGVDLVDSGTLTIAGAGRGGQPLVLTDLPQFCRVSLLSQPAAGSEIRSEVWLPLEGWNGRFQGVGNRGWGGSINYALLVPAVRQGFAAASTDTGHQGGGAAFAFGQPEKVIDAGHRAVHVMTGTAKSVVAAFYGRGAAFAYWNGCSLGGRQGLSLAQRYPQDYDGIVVGDPAHNLTDLYSARLSMARTVHRSADSYIPPPKLETLHDAVVTACDALDGVADGVLEDPRVCRFDPAVLQCTPDGDEQACLTAAQVETARAMYHDVLHPRTGERLSAGLTPGAERRWGAVAGIDADDNSLGLFRYVSLGDPDWNWRGDDFVEAVDRTRAEAGPVLDAIDPDLTAFVARGGRLLLYHGWADPQTPAGNTIAYYDAVAERIGSTRVADHVSLFMVPGMGHCSGGEGTDVFDPVSPLVEWVEQGRRPERIEAARMVDGRTVRTRPLCPWGQVAAWNGSGSADDSINFSCQPAGAGRESIR
jgi:feruloyl esterase